MIIDILKEIRPLWKLRDFPLDCGKIYITGNDDIDSIINKLENGIEPNNNNFSFRVNNANYCISLKHLSKFPKINEDSTYIPWIEGYQKIINELMTKYGRKYKIEEFLTSCE